MSICSCEFPLIIIDKRSGKDVEYISIPIEIVDEMGEIIMPEMSIVETEGLDGIVQEYMKVSWKKPHDKTSKYDVRGHIVVAGCPEDAIQCDAKSIFDVYHPINDWISDHVIELKNE